MHTSIYNRPCISCKEYLYVDKECEVDTIKLTCTCTISRTGYPSEPYKHQHTVANKLNVTAPNLFPYFSADGGYMLWAHTRLETRLLCWDEGNIITNHTNISRQYR